ncbi:MAG: ATP-grasp domain-containing protein [Gemmatimonadaceae bacterium]
MTRHLRVALATYEKAPRLAPDDRGLIPALARLGVEAEPAVWSREREWDEFDAVVVRSCWDYHRRAGEFLGWLDRLAAQRIPTWNSPEMIWWNADKRYLFDLAARGVNTVPTIVIENATPDDVVAACAAQDWTRFVVKPAVSASGYETYALSTPVDEASAVLLERATAVGDVLVQPFVEEFGRDGEYSFVFIEGGLSHAAIKRPADGEFRVQAEFGGSATPIDAPSVFAEQAATALAVLPEVPLYARVDGVVLGRTFLLTELELIEPNLFLESVPGATDRLAGAIAKRLATAL